MLLLPPKPGTCPICATTHAAELPHNAQSLYYRYRFFGLRNRWPTWADAVAHCTPEMRDHWERELRARNAWTEPDDGEPIADPPAESIWQATEIPQARPVVMTMTPADARARKAAGEPPGADDQVDPKPSPARPGREPDRSDTGRGDQFEMDR